MLSSGTIQKISGIRTKRWGWAGEHKGPESSSRSTWLLAESVECVWVIGEILEVLLIKSGRVFHSSACLPDANDHWMPRAYRRF